MPDPDDGPDLRHRGPLAPWTSSSRDDLLAARFIEETHHPNRYRWTEFDDLLLTLAYRRFLAATRHA